VDNNKKVKVVETCGKDRKTLGMFYLINADVRVGEVFPRDMEEKICVDFTCKGKECTRENCPFKHPVNPRDMDKCSVIAISRNFSKTKKGWLSDYHFRNETALPADVLAMMGGSQGPTKK
jgi:hypothetical protein